MGLFSSFNPLEMLTGGGGGGGSSSFSGGGAFNKENTNYNASATTTKEYSDNTTVGNGGFLLQGGSTYSYDGRSSTSVLDLSSRFTDNRQSWVDSSDRSQSWTDTSNRSTTVQDSSSRDYSQTWTDQSNRSTNVQDSSSRDYSQSWVDSSSRTNTTTINNADASEITRYNAALLQAVGEDQGETVRLISRIGAESLATSAKAATDLFATASAEAGKAWGHTVDKASEALDKLFSSTRSSLADTLSAGSTVITRSIDATPDGSAASTARWALIGAALVVVGVLFIRKA